MHLVRMMVTLFLLVAGAAAASAAARCDAANFVIGAGNAIDRAARSRSAAAFSAVVSRYADVNAISLFALGRYRKQLPAGRQPEYAALTRRFIGKFMAGRSGKFRAANLRIVECAGSAKARTVNARLASGHRVIFKLYRTRGGFRISDMSIESIWLAQQLRSTFVNVITRNDGDINALFAYLRN